MNQLTMISGVRGYVDSNGTAQLNLEDVSRGLGFTERGDYIRWQRVEGYLSELGFSTCGERPEFIPENIFYRLAMKAKNTAAEAFQAKVADEILPAIRKHGGYLTADKVEEVLLNPDTIIQLATQLKKEREAKAQLEQKVQLDKPKVLFAEALEVSKDSILIGELAKLLKQNGFDIGEGRLFRWMRENGYLIKRKGTDYNMPTQLSMELKIMEIKVGQRSSASEGVKITKTPKVTGKGQLYFINKFKEAAEFRATPEGQRIVEQMKLERKQSTDEFIGMMKESSKPFTPYRQERQGFLRQSTSESAQQ